MKHKIVLSLVIAGLLASSAVQAEALSYNYVYLTQQRDRIRDNSFNNTTGGAFKEIGHYFHVFTSYGNAGNYGNPAWQNSRAFRLGAGTRWHMGDDTLVALELSAVRAQFDKPGIGTIHDTGFSTIVELRHRFNPKLEGIVSTTYSDVLNRKTYEGVIGPVFHINDTYAIGVLYRRTQNSSGLAATLKVYYGSKRWKGE